VFHFLVSEQRWIWGVDQYVDEYTIARIRPLWPINYNPLFYEGVGSISTRSWALNHYYRVLLSTMTRIRTVHIPQRLISLKVRVTICMGFQRIFMYISILSFINLEIFVPGPVFFSWINLILTLILGFPLGILYWVVYFWENLTNNKCSVFSSKSGVQPERFSKFLYGKNLGRGHFCDFSKTQQIDENFS